MGLMVLLHCRRGRGWSTLHPGEAFPKSNEKGSLPLWRSWWSLWSREDSGLLSVGEHGCGRARSRGIERWLGYFILLPAQGDVSKL